MLTTGIVAGLVCVVGGALAGGTAGATFIAMGIALPALLAQDAWRFVFFAGGRDRDAVLTDFVWAVALVAFLILVTRIAPGTPGAVLAWGASAVVGALVGAWRAAVLPRPGSTRSWMREHSDLVGRYSAEVLIGLGANQATIYVVGLTAGLAQAGSLRAAQILLGPMHVVLQAAHLIAVPEGVRIRLRRPDRFRLAIGGLSVGLASVIGAWVLVLALLPVTMGQALLGDSWAEAQVVLVPLGLALVAQGVSGGALVGLRVLADAKSSLRARIIDSAFGFVLGVGGALIGGALGAAWGVAAGEWVSAVVFIGYFLRSERLHRGIANPDRRTGRDPGPRPARGASGDRSGGRDDGTVARSTPATKAAGPPARRTSTGRTIARGRRAGPGPPRATPAGPRPVRRRSAAPGSPHRRRRSARRCGSRRRQGTERRSPGSQRERSRSLPSATASGSRPMGEERGLRLACDRTLGVDPVSQVQPRDLVQRARVPAVEVRAAKLDDRTRAGIETATASIRASSPLCVGS